MKSRTRVILFIACISIVLIVAVVAFRIQGCSARRDLSVIISQSQTVDQALSEIRELDPIHEAQIAYECDDMRLIAISGSTVEVPGVPSDKVILIKEIPISVRVSDAIYSQDHEFLNELIFNFSIAYNRELLRLGSDRVLAIRE